MLRGWLGTTTALFSRNPIKHRSRRTLALVSFVGLLLLSASACGPQGPQPTPDPFSGLSQQADEAFARGLEAFERGEFREALNQFERARILSPQREERIEQMIERSRAALAPTPTVGAATATPTTPDPTATPVFINRATPDEDLGTQYFGSVFLSVVPGRNIVPPPMNEFFYEDQIALHIEGLNQRLRLPFSLRVFDLDTGALVANVRNEGAVPTAGATGQPTRTPTAPATAVRGPGTPAGTPMPTPTPSPADFRIARFWDNFVWYHEGGERPGRYRVELYSNGTMTHAFDYLVGNVPVPLPVQPTLEPVPIEPPAPAAPPEGKPEGAAPNGEGAPVPTPIPLPTATSTPESAISTVIGGITTSMDANLTTRKVYVLDASGSISTVDRGRPTLDKPFNLGRVPVDMVVDQLTGSLYVSARSDPAIMILSGTTGQSLGTIALPVNPGEIQLDPLLGILYVLLPDRQAVALVDVRSGTIVRTTTGLAQITGMALDQTSHTLYTVSLGGQLTVLDGRSGQITARFGISNAGTSGLATANGLVFSSNVASRQLLIVDPEARTTRTVALLEEPGALAAGEASGTVYVLGTRSNSILRFDAASGRQVGQVMLPERSGNFGVRLPTDGDFQTQRSKILLLRGDETLFVTQPGSGFLSMVPPLLFPRVASAPDSGTLLASAPAETRAVAAQAASTATPARAVTALPSAGASPGRGSPSAVTTPPERLAALASQPQQQAQQEVAATAAATQRPPTATARPATATPRPASPTPRPTATAVPTRDVSAMVASSGPQMPAGLDWAMAGGHFFTQANGADLGASKRGYALVDSGVERFWSAYQQLGGVETLGYPISQRFAWKGQPVQLTQRGLLQWNPGAGEMTLVNVMDEMHDRGWDERLLREHFVPKQLSNEGEAGLTHAQVVARRLTLLEADEALKERYLASPNFLAELGLPTSRVMDLGPVIAIRTQRAVLYRWKTPQPWARAGDVTVGLSGDIARQFGLFGESPLPFQPDDTPLDTETERFAVRPSDETDDA